MGFSRNIASIKNWTASILRGKRLYHAGRPIQAVLPSENDTRSGKITVMVEESSSTSENLNKYLAVEDEESFSVHFE